MRPPEEDDGDVLIPNELTIAAMEEARTGKLISFQSVEASMADLDGTD